jgi:hypothetical protein
MMTLNKAIRVARVIPQQADDKKNKKNKSRELRLKKYEGREIYSSGPFWILSSHADYLFRHPICKVYSMLDTCPVGS